MNPGSPKISVIVPVYNVADYLEECVNAILTQTFSDFELLLIDDGSTDESPEICDRYAETDRRVRVVHRTNAGPSKTRNHGLEISRGEYIVFCDSDDFYDEHALELMYNLMGQYNTDLAMCGYCRFYEDGVTATNNYRLAQYTVTIMQSRMELASLFLKPQTNLFGISIWGKMYRADLIRNNQIRFPEDIDYEEDCCFNIQYFRYVTTTGARREVLYHYRQRQESLSKGYRQEAFPFLINGLQRRREFLVDIGMEDRIPSLNAIFLVVVINHYKKIFFSSLKRKERKAEYFSLISYPEVVQMASEMKPFNSRLTRWLIKATRERNAAKIDNILTVWYYKNKAVVFLRRAKYKLKLFISNHS